MTYIPTLPYLAKRKGEGKISQRKKHTGISQWSAYKLLQHERGADDLGFVHLALGFGHQEHIREEEQIHIQLQVEA